MLHLSCCPNVKKFTLSDKSMKRHLAILIFMWPVLMLAQPSNDECTRATVIRDPKAYCSKNGEFNNVGATPSSRQTELCFDEIGNDVWFSFVAQATDVNISVVGATQFGQGGTLRNPQVALIFGACNATTTSEIQCESDVSNMHIVEMYEGGLIIGQPYYIRVSGRAKASGTFKLCINNYFAPASPSSDCPDGAVLCDKSPFSNPQVSGAGNVITELDDATCFQGGLQGNNFESNSTWYKWICSKAGRLTFTLTPSDLSDDWDFVLYELPNGVNDCAGKKVLRCMAAGEDRRRFPSVCLGLTGLRDGETDISEPPGCDRRQSNWLSPVVLEEGKAYALALNNYTQQGNGFSIQWGGDAEFLGPEVDFLAAPQSGLKCEQEFTLTDRSTFSLGSITERTWYLGDGAVPANATGIGPIMLNYNSFGPKVVTLQIKTDRGCVVSDTATIMVEPCCEDLPDLGLDDEVSNLVCSGLTNGTITLTGTGGTPWYKYALEDGEYDFNNLFDSLAAGDYTARILDAHGCEFMRTVTIAEPEPLVVDAGPDQEVKLGYTADFNGSYTPPFPATITWTSNKGDSIRCLDPSCLSMRVLPPGTTEYYLTVQDASGCMAIDTVLALVELIREVYFPNVFSPNLDGNNDAFVGHFGPAAQGIDVLRVFDRWGGLVYEAKELVSGDNSRGWDGTVNGQDAPPGVYAFMAMVRFVDNMTIPYSGTITLLR